MPNNTIAIPKQYQTVPNRTETIKIRQSVPNRTETIPKQYQAVPKIPKIPNCTKLYQSNTKEYQTKLKL